LENYFSHPILEKMMQKKRILTLNCIVRKYQIEKTRTEFEGHDETSSNTPETVDKLAHILHDGFPEIKLTWALSWCALTDQSENYKVVRAKIQEYHTSWGDDITFIPGGYFANRYNSRDQVNQDITDAIQIIKQEFDFTPKTLVAGFLSAANIKYAYELEGIQGIQGNIWSQYSVDNMDGDGSIAYPYYPATQHFCKPGQTPEDTIPCLNFDGWTVDFFNARLVGCRKPKMNSRMGVGPIETLRNLGAKKGLQEIQSTTNAHFEHSWPYNPFVWITNNIEVTLVKEISALPYLTNWLSWTKQRWPDVECPTLREFTNTIQTNFPDNDSLAYELHQTGNGISYSDPKKEIIWYMNKQFRLGIEKDKHGPKFIFDYTRYDQEYMEPQKTGERNWSIMDKINQKNTRKQDKPILINKFPEWNNLKSELEKIYAKNLSE
jgi:hypothetical protein